MSVKETPALLCSLSDVTNDPQYYHKAWELSRQRSSRAMRGLGFYHLRACEVCIYLYRIRTLPKLSVSHNFFFYCVLYSHSTLLMSCCSMKRQWLVLRRHWQLIHSSCPAGSPMVVLHLRHRTMSKLPKHSVAVFTSNLTTLRLGIT